MQRKLRYLVGIVSGLALACQPASFSHVEETAEQAVNADSADANAALESEEIVIAQDALPANVPVEGVGEVADQTAAEPPAADKAKDTAKDVMLACANAAKEGKLVEAKRTLVFPKIVDYCQFEKNDNLSAKSLFVRARSEQGMSVELNDVNRLCSLRLDMPQQQMKFDDEILILLNDVVLAASQNYSQKVLDAAGKAFFPTGLAEDNDGLVSYKWLGPNGLRGLPYYSGKVPRYCLGVDPKASDFDKRCMIPYTDQTGSLRVEIPQESVAKLAAKTGLKFDETLKQAAVARFGFVTTGDNDNSDCQHLGFKIDVTYSYIKK